MIDTYAIDHAVPAPLLAAGDKTWFLLWADIALGKSLVRDVLPVLKAGGATVVGQTSHPLFTTDMSSPILAAQSSKAQVVALMDVGGDLVNAAKQANEFGLIAGGQTLAGFWMTVTDAHAIGLDVAQGITFAEAFYWDQDDAARAWSKRFLARVGAEPNSYQAGIYGAITHYLKAVRAAGTAEPAAVMAKMRELPVEDFMTPGGGSVRADGRVIRPIQVLQVKAPADSHGPWDIARVVATIPGEKAFRPLAESDCPLVRR